MCREHHRHLPLAIQTGQQRGDFELISEVERCGRLVEQQDLGRLREGAGDDDALFLAAAQRHVAAIGQMCRACRLERLSRDGEVRGPFELKRAEVRMAPHQHHLHHGVIEGGMRLLRHDRDVARQLAARHRPERAVAKTHASTVWTQDAAQQLEQRGLAAPVRTEKARERTRRDLHRRIGQRKCAAVRE